MTALWVDVVSRSLLVASVATALATTTAVPIAYILSRRELPGKKLLSAVLILPMVLPPTAVGTLLLSLLGANGLLGRNTLGFDLELLFTWRAAVIASAVMAFPLVLRTAKVSFDAVEPRLEDMARTLGYSFPRLFLTITLPIASKGLYAAALLGFLRALGEYGATVMVAGNIPGQTQTLALAIEASQAAGHDAEAMSFVFMAIALGLICLLVVEYWTATTISSKRAS